MRRLFILSGLVALIGCLPGIASAQLGNSGNRIGSSGSTGSSGFGGSGGFGGSSSSGFGGGSSGFGGGSSGFGGGGSGFGSSGFGNGGGMGSGGFGNSGNSGMGGMGQNGAGGQNGFLGANPNQNSFLGRGNAQNQGGAMGLNGMMNQLGNNRGGNRNANRGNMNTMSSMFNNGGSMNGQSSAPPIRPRQRVAFDYPLPKGEVLQTTLQSQLTKSAIRRPAMANVMVSLNSDGEVLMRGAVSSQSEAKLVENMMRLEPGVRSVRNELTYPNAAGDAE